MSRLRHAEFNERIGFVGFITQASVDFDHSRIDGGRTRRVPTLSTHDSQLTESPCLAELVAVLTVEFKCLR